MYVLHQGPRAPRLRGLAVLAAVCGLLLACVVAVPTRALAAPASGSGHEPVTARVPVSVSLSGDEAVDESFRFEIVPADDESAQPAESVVTVEGAGEASFSFTFDRVGEHHYTVRQLAGDAANWTYDDRVYDVTVYCMWNEATDDLYTTVIIENAEGYKADSCSFENSYAAPSEPAASDEPTAQTPSGVPSTGDVTSYAPIVALVCVGVALVCVAVWHSRRGTHGGE